MIWSLNFLVQNEGPLPPEGLNSDKVDTMMLFPVYSATWCLTWPKIPSLSLIDEKKLIILHGPVPALAFFRCFLWGVAFASACPIAPREKNGNLTQQTLYLLLQSVVVWIIGMGILCLRMTFWALDLVWSLLWLAGVTAHVGLTRLLDPTRAHMSAANSVTRYFFRWWHVGIGLWEVAQMLLLALWLAFHARAGKRSLSRELICFSCRIVVL
jgi:hypothetical protein